MNTAAGRLARRATAQIGMLSAQLLLGMAVNLIGLPKEVSGTDKTITTIFLGLHMAIGVGLLVGSVLTIKLARKVSSHFTRDAWIGASFIAGTVLAGLLTFLLDNNWWSYVMTAGFLASFLLYGALFTYASRQSKA